MIEFDPASPCGTVECDEAWTAGRWRRHWHGIGHYAADKGVIRVFMHYGGKVRLQFIDWTHSEALHGFVKKPTTPETEMMTSDGFPLAWVERSGEITLWRTAGR
jgi:hypothetical protein